MDAETLGESAEKQEGPSARGREGKAPHPPDQEGQRRRREEEEENREESGDPDEWLAASMESMEEDRPLPTTTRRFPEGQEIPCNRYGLVSLRVHGNETQLSERAQKVFRELGFDVVVGPFRQDEGMTIICGLTRALTEEDRRLLQGSDFIRDVTPLTGVPIEGERASFRGNTLENFNSATHVIVVMAALDGVLRPGAMYRRLAVERRLRELGLMPDAASSPARDRETADLAALFRRARSRGDADMPAPEEASGLVLRFHRTRRLTDTDLGMLQTYSLIRIVFPDR